MVGVRPRDAAAGPRRDAEAAVAGLDELEAGDVLVQERDDRALAVVVERGVRDAVGVDAAPLLPHGGGAAVDHDEPRRLGVLEEQVVGDVEVAGVGEHRQQERRGEEAGAEVGAGGADELDEPVGRRGAQVVGDRGRRRGRGRRWPGCRAWWCRRRRGTRCARRRRRWRRARRSGRRRRRGRGCAAISASCAGGAVEVGGGDRRRGRRPWRRAIASSSVSPASSHSPKCQPRVPEVPLVRRGLGRALDARRVAAGGGRVGGVVDPRLHRRPLVGEHLAVAGGAVERPTARGPRRRPIRRSPRSAARSPAGGRRRDATRGRGW